MPLPRKRYSPRLSTLLMRAQVRRLTTADFTLVISPSWYSGKRMKSCSQVTSPRTASPRNSRRSLEARRVLAPEVCVRAARSNSGWRKR